MLNHRFFVPFKMIARRLVVLLVSMAVLFGLSQTAALANSAPNPLVALAASSRFAAQAESEALKPDIPEEKLSKMREQRREWQNKASAAAAAEGKTEPSTGNLVRDKLNLDEITQENEMIKNYSGADSDNVR